MNWSEKAFEYFSGRYSSAVEGITVYQNFKDFLMDELKPMESGHPKASMKHRSRIGGGGGGLVVVTLDWVVQI